MASEVGLVTRIVANAIFLTGLSVSLITSLAVGVWGALELLVPLFPDSPVWVLIALALGLGPFVLTSALWMAFVGGGPGE